MSVRPPLAISVHVYCCSYNAIPTVVLAPPTASLRDAVAGGCALQWKPVLSQSIRGQGGGQFIDRAAYSLIVTVCVA